MIFKDIENYYLSCGGVSFIQICDLGDFWKHNLKKMSNCAMIWLVGHLEFEKVMFCMITIQLRDTPHTWFSLMIIHKPKTTRWDVKLPKHSNLYKQILHNINLTGIPFICTSYLIMSLRVAIEILFSRRNDFIVFYAITRKWHNFIGNILQILNYNLKV